MYNNNNNNYYNNEYVDNIATWRKHGYATGC